MASGGGAGTELLPLAFIEPSRQIFYRHDLDIKRIIAGPKY